MLKIVDKTMLNHKTCEDIKLERNEKLRKHFSVKAGNKQVNDFFKRFSR
jgi:hypothetical protein